MYVSTLTLSLQTPPHPQQKPPFLVQYISEEFTGGVPCPGFHLVNPTEINKDTSTLNKGESAHQGISSLSNISIYCHRCAEWYVCMRTSLCVCIYVYVYTHMHTHTQMCVHVCIYIICMYACVHGLCMHVYIFIGMYVCACVYISVCVCMCACMCIYL